MMGIILKKFSRISAKARPNFILKKQESPSYNLAMFKP